TAALRRLRRGVRGGVRRRRRIRRARRRGGVRGVMDADAFEAQQRAREYYHGLRVLPGAFVVIRVDGRGFSKFTEANFDKPCDDRFSALMVETASALMAELGARYGYTESDEISILLDPASSPFGSSVEKLVSLSAGIESATFTHAAGLPAHFDSRI